MLAMNNSYWFHLIPWKLEAGEATDEEHQWIGLKDYHGLSIHWGFPKNCSLERILEGEPKQKESDHQKSLKGHVCHLNHLDDHIISVSVRVSNGYQSSRSPRSTRSWKVLLKVWKSEQIVPRSTAFNRILCFQRWCPLLSLPAFVLVRVHDEYLLPLPEMPEESPHPSACFVADPDQLGPAGMSAGIEDLRLMTMGRKSLGP